MGVTVAQNGQRSVGRTSTSEVGQPVGVPQAGGVGVRVLVAVDVAVLGGVGVRVAQIAQLSPHGGDHSVSSSRQTGAVQVMVGVAQV